PADRRARRAFLRRDHQRLRRDARLLGTDSRRGPLGAHRLCSRTPVQRSRNARRRALFRTGQDPVSPAITQTADVAIPELKGLQQRLLIAGAVGAVVSVLGFLLNSRQFFQSYLMAYMLWLGVTLGCLALGMVHQLSGGAWGGVIRPPIGAAARVLPVMTLFFLPIVVGMTYLYPWTNADLVAHDEI